MLNGTYWTTVQTLGEDLLCMSERSVALLSKLAFAPCPVPFNGVQLAVELREKQANVPCLLNLDLNQGPLVSEVLFHFETPSHATPATSAIISCVEILLLAREGRVLLRGKIR